jgi:hypothetical protein
VAPPFEIGARDTGPTENSGLDWLYVVELRDADGESKESDSWVLQNDGHPSEAALAEWILWRARNFLNDRSAVEQFRELEQPHRRTIHSAELSGCECRTSEKLRSLGDPRGAQRAGRPMNRPPHDPHPVNILVLGLIGWAIIIGVLLEIDRDWLGLNAGPSTPDPIEQQYLDHPTGH